MRILSCDGLTVLGPLSPKIDQHQSSPCNTHVCFRKLSGHENYGHDHTDSLTTSPNYYYRKCIGTTNENLNIDITI